MLMKNLIKLPNTNNYEMGLVHPKTSNPLNIPIYKNDYSDEQILLMQMGKLLFLKILV